MKESRRILAALYCVLASHVVQAQYDIDTRLPTCDTFAWSQAVRDSYPDMQQICRGIYQRDGVRYAQAEVEVLRVSGNRMTVRTIRPDRRQVTAGGRVDCRAAPDRLHSAASFRVDFRGGERACEGIGTSFRG